MNTTLSLAIIAKNEEKVLARCLDSVKDLVDEIIIVDTGSTDKTKEIALKYTDKIFDFKWVNDFSKARNFSFDQCTKEWIIWLDADDIIKEKEKQKIRKFNFSDKNIIMCNYEYSHDEYDNSELTVPRERIIRRSLGLKWLGRIHECLDISKNPNWFISDISVDHYKQAGSSLRNLKILEEIILGYEKCKKGSTNGLCFCGSNKKFKSCCMNENFSREYFYIGAEYKDAGMPKDAVIALEKFVKMSTAWWEDKYKAYNKLAELYYPFIKDEIKYGNDELFTECIFKSLEIEPRQAEPRYSLGQYYFDQRQYEKAIYWHESCLQIERPKGLLGSYQPSFYTWKPCQSLVLAYNAINKLEKANEYNEMVFKYRPNDSMALNNRNIFKNCLKNKDGQGKKLNLGCGGKTMQGYTNVDIFEGEGVDEIFNLDKIPYNDNSIATINSEHSLEHVMIAQVDKALREWFRVLKPGGELILKIPDLEQCCQKYLQAKPESYERLWYKFTLFGYQNSLAGEPDEAQIHRSGFSKSEIEILLHRTGFIIDYSENYDGWDTPSVGIRALKPVSNLKVGWIAPQNWEAAQTRIRVLNIDRFLRSQGYYSKIVNYPEIINQNFDIAITGKIYDEHHFKNIKMLKQCGKIVYCDICEDILEHFWVKEILTICDKVICCSYSLAEKVESINKNVVVIEDAYET